MITNCIFVKLMNEATSNTTKCPNWPCYAWKFNTFNCALLMFIVQSRKSQEEITLKPVYYKSESIVHLNGFIGFFRSRQQLYFIVCLYWSYRNNRRFTVCSTHFEFVVIYTECIRPIRTFGHTLMLAGSHVE